MLSHLLKKRSNVITARWIVMIIDISLVLQTFFLAYLVRFNFHLNFGSHHFLMQLPLIVALSVVAFYLVGSYKGVIRHTGTRDAYNVFKAAVLLAIFLGIIILINRQFNILMEFTIPRSIIVIHFLLNVIVLIASRYIFKMLYNILVTGLKDVKRVLIYGAGDSGLLTYAAIQKDPHNKTKVFGYIDDDMHKTGKTYDRVLVYSSKHINDAFIEKNKIQEIIVSIQKIASSDLSKIVDKISKLGVKIKIVPPIEDWIGGNLKTSQIKEIKIEDLLSRQPIQLNNKNVQDDLKDKVVLVTGAAGSIGSEIANQISNYQYKKLILLDQAESPLYDLQQSFIQKDSTNFQCIVTDVRNKERLKRIFLNNKIDVIYHAAAYKHVPLMENNPYEAVSVNVLGTKNVMDLAVEYKVQKFIMVSTDKAVNPTNVMGATKRVAEIYAGQSAKKSKTQFITTRFGNVLGSNGSVIPLFKKQIEEGGPLTLTHKEITRYFMTIPEACQLVLEAGSMGKGQEIFVFDMGDSVKIFDLAKKMIRLSGFKYPSEIDVKIIGLRPGEKLYEELLSDKENNISTHNPKIMIAKVESSITEKQLLSALAILQKDLISETEIVKQLKVIVPEYISNNSVYSSLDA
ncbi:MAG TPA: polysaccharide biosynthesis protein [Lutibacter sp.]|nr:polysaccharide biosynthesis protein [Lutibacter sp.]